MIHQKENSLRVIDFIPNEILDCQPQDLKKLLKTPTLIKIKQKSKPFLFLSVLLHGNETSGFLVVQRLLKQHLNRNWNKSLAIFIGNVSAAEYGLRKLDDGVDFNRIWVDSEFARLCHPESYPFVSELKNELKKLDIFAHLDIHNTSGVNPIYACITELNHSAWLIAQCFSTSVIKFIEPNSVLTQYTAKLAPSVVLECGVPGYEPGITKSLQLIERLIEIDDLEQLNLGNEAQLYCTNATIKIKPHTHINFTQVDYADLENELAVRSDIESFNFNFLEYGQTLAIAKNNPFDYLSIIDNESVDVTHEYLERDGNKLKVKSAFMGCMFTKDKKIAVEDCLGYIVKPLPFPTESIANFD